MIENHGFVEAGSILLNSSRRGLLAPNLVDRRLEEASGAACKSFDVVVKFPRLIGVREGGEKRGRERWLAGKGGRGESGGLGGGLDGRSRGGGLGQPRGRGRGVEVRREKREVRNEGGERN